MKKLLALFALICLCALSAPALGDAIVTEGVLIFSDAEAACYTSADLGGTVKQMRAKARFYGGGACFALRVRPFGAYALSETEDENV